MPTYNSRPVLTGGRSSALILRPDARRQYGRSTTARKLFSPMSSIANAAQKLKFAGTDAFQKSLKARVDRYFRFTKRSPRDCPQMYLKTAVVLLWFAASYVLLVFAAPTWWLAIPLAASMGLSIASI